MEASGSQIPVVDFSVMGLENADPLNENRQAVKIVADQLYRAFSTIGFAYLQNHGIPEQMVIFFRFFCPDEDGCHKNSETRKFEGSEFSGSERYEVCVFVTSRGGRRGFISCGISVIEMLQYYLARRNAVFRLFG